jgi:hypothetical protein
MFFFLNLYNPCCWLVVLRQFLVFCVVFCEPCFVFVFFSFGHCIVFIFFHWKLLITRLVSSKFSYSNQVPSPVCSNDIKYLRKLWDLVIFVITCRRWCLACVISSWNYIETLYIQDVHLLFWTGKVKQHIHILLSLVWPDRYSNSQSTALETSTLTITPPMWFPWK